MEHHHHSKIAELARHFFSRIKGDNDLEAIFKEIEPGKIAHHPETFHAHAFGEGRYSDDEIAEAHKGLTLKDHHFDAMVDHFVSSLAEHGYGDEEKAQAREMLSKYRTQVLGE